MSWDSHIEAMKSSGADDCCIADQGGNIWAKSASLNSITQQEVAAIIKAAKGQNLEGERLELNGIPLMKVKDLDGNHTGCTLVTKSSSDKELCCAALSNKAVVVVKKGGPNQRQAVEICEREVQYLKDSQY